MLFAGVCHCWRSIKEGDGRFLLCGCIFRIVSIHSATCRGILCHWIVRIIFRGYTADSILEREFSVDYCIFWMVVSRFPFSFNSRITVLSGTFVSSPCIRNSPSGTLGVEEQPANSPPVSRKQIVIIRPFILSVFSYTLCWRNNKAKTLIFTNTISPNSYAIFVKFLVICKQMVGNLINNQDNDCFWNFFWFFQLKDCWNSMYN